MMVTFLVTAGPSAGNYVIGFEDLWPTGGDRDFEEPVMEIVNGQIVPNFLVPEPSTWMLLGLSLPAVRRLRRDCLKREIQRMA